MPVQLNHTIALATDPDGVGGAPVARCSGSAPPRRYGPFHEVQLDNGVTIDFMDSGGQPILGIHYAFLVTEDEFDEIFGRIKERGLDYWADPHKQRAGRDQPRRRRPRRLLGRTPTGTSSRSSRSRTAAGRTER